jgi:hypothetical protein
LVSDGRNHFTHAHDSSQIYGFSDTNPYVEAFFKWWESDLHKTLRELRITGGEPLMSGHTWKLLEWFNENQGESNTKLAINSNLGMDDKQIDKFIDVVQGLDVEVYTSCESLNGQAEYIRDGLNYYQWFDNMVKLYKSGAVKQLHVMATINGLCLPKLPDFLAHMIDFKQAYGRDSLTVTLNILRFPSFQSPLVMPHDVKQGCATRLQQFLDQFGDSYWLHQMEVEHIKRLIEYLNSVESPHAGASSIDILQKDFKTFYTQYDQRRNKNFVKTFPELKDWYDSL